MQARGFPLGYARGLTFPIEHMNPKATAVLLLACLGWLSGCAALPRPPAYATAETCWSNGEQAVERTRFFPGVDEQQALQAAERILRLAGKDDMQIDPTPHSVSAEFHRRSMIYLFLVAHSTEVRDRWIVSTRPASDGVWICVQVNGQYFSDTFVLGAEPMTHAVYPASAVDPSPGRRFKPPARSYPVNYDTFWQRMEYLFGLSDAWTGCKPGGGIQRHAARARLEMDPLCHVLEDAPPDVPR